VLGIASDLSIADLRQRRGRDSTAANCFRVPARSTLSASICPKLTGKFCGQWS